MDPTQSPDREFLKVVNYIGRKLEEKYPKASDAFRAFDFIGVLYTDFPSNKKT